MKPRKAIEDLKPYEVKDETYILKLDANESEDYLALEKLELRGLELYPDYDSKELRMALSKDLNVDASFITMGNGSSELLDLLFKAYVRKDDVILSFDPSFSMYEIYANIYETNFVKIPSNPDFSLDIDLMIDRLYLNPKIILICSPNNPTGYLIPKEDIKRLIIQTNALVIVDEAYMEFSSKDSSLIHEIETHKNLVVLRTFSKAYGLAGARLGYMLSSYEATEVIKKIRSPYHVNTLSQKLGLLALSKKELIRQSIEKIKQTRANFGNELEKLGFIVYPSEGNFIWVKPPQLKLSQRLKEKGVLVRKIQFNDEEYARITIKTDEDMSLCLSIIKEIIHENK